MPIKHLDNPNPSKGSYKFGGGKETIYTETVGGDGYTIYTQGSDDTIYGSANGDTLTGGNASDTIFGGDGEDYIYGGHPDRSEDPGKGKGAIAHNLLVGDGTLNPDGTYGDSLELTSGPLYTASRDWIFGGAGADNDIYGDFNSVSLSGASYEGGDDVLSAIGDAAEIAIDSVDLGRTNWLYGDADVVTLDGGTITGGDDILVAGAGNDHLVGDWKELTGSGTAVTGADTFYFTVLGGDDIVYDYEGGKDSINFYGSWLREYQLDTVNDDVIDANDAYAYMDGANLVLDLTSFSNLKNKWVGTVDTTITFIGVDHIDVSDITFYT